MKIMADGDLVLLRSLVSHGFCALDGPRPLLAITLVI